MGERDTMDCEESPATIDTPQSFWVTAILLAVVLVLGVGVRAYLGANKTKLWHDEAISYLAAAGHQGAYQDQIAGDTATLSGHWVPVE